MNSKYIASVLKLKEMVQFGAGVTFADLMNDFEATKPLARSLMPWLPFSVEGDLMCCAVPEPDGFDLGLVLASSVSPVRFPRDPSLLFSTSGTSQTVFVISGSLEVERQGPSILLTEGQSYKLKAGSLNAFSYGENGLYMFKQEPGLPPPESFSFEYKKSV